MGCTSTVNSFKNNLLQRPHGFESLHSVLFRFNAKNDTGIAYSFYIRYRYTKFRSVSLYRMSLVFLKMVMLLPTGTYRFKRYTYVYLCAPLDTAKFFKIVFPQQEFEERITYPDHDPAKIYGSGSL